MIKKIFLALIGIVIAILFYYFPAPSDRMLNIQNYLITVGGIISAILIVSEFIKESSKRDSFSKLS
jgi:hypothetical protein